MKELVEAVQRGERTAARALFDRCHRRVMGYCLRCANADRERALDWTQEVFARVFRSVDTLADPERFDGWLFTIAANVCRTHGVREARRKEALQRFVLEMEARPPPDDPSERERRITAVREVLANIEDNTLRKIVTLKYTDPEHTTRQIAAQLGMPYGTVTVKLMRFRASRKQELARVLLAN